MRSSLRPTLPNFHELWKVGGFPATRRGGLFDLPDEFGHPRSIRSGPAALSRELAGGYVMNAFVQAAKSVVREAFLVL